MDITDEEGNFRIAAVFEGVFDIIVNPTDKGYMHPNRRTVDSIEVRVGSRVGGLRLVYDVATDLTISGLVTDSSGQPMAGERVGYIPSEAASVSLHVLTDADGYYRIEGLSDGQYDIDVYRTRNNFHHQLAGGSAQAGTENLDFVVTRFTTVRGRVVQPDGQTPVSDFTLTRGDAFAGMADLSEALANSRSNQEIHNPEGSFELDMIGPGTLTIAIRAEGYLGAVEMIEVTEGESIEDLVMRLEPGGALIGEVVNEMGEAIPDAVIYLGRLNFYEHSPYQPIARSGSDGTFEIASPIVGELVLATVHPDYAYAVQSVSVPNPGRIQIVLPWGGYISGAAWLNGEPASSGYVSAYTEVRQTDSRLSSSLESQGAFELGPAPPGEMIVQLSVNTGEGQGLIREQTVYVESGKTTVADFEFFSGMTTVFGEIHTEADEWRWCLVRLLTPDGGDGTRYSVGVQGQESFFQIENVLPGLYLVEAEAQPRQAGSTGRLRYSGEVFVPEEGEVRHDVVLILEDAE